MDVYVKGSKVWMVAGALHEEGRYCTNTSVMVKDEQQDPTTAKFNKKYDVSVLMSISEVGFET